MARFKIQKSSSTINWTGKKVLGLHTGSINIAEGYIEVTDNQLTGGEVQVDMTSIDITDIEDKKTRKEFLDHLLSADFFSVDKFRTAKLVIAGSSKTDNGKFKVDGTLAIKDISRPISFIAP